ncbi:MAG: arginine repressor [Lachnospiraceae bacterium]|jgi:transcriptional regulator of arginine metabolism|nr:arginine repressor [Lachnospiraceae bacterium]
MSKYERHSKIVELVGKYEIETQEELAVHLKREGFLVTQATVSRDMRELKLTKTATSGARQRYSAIADETDAARAALNERFVRVLQEGFTSMDMAQNILVIKTLTGMAMAVAAALDAMKFPEVVGCIAGDDTIMCVLRTVGETNLLMGKIRKLLDG